MKKEINAYIEDIRFSILRIEFHIREMPFFADFKLSYTVYDAVERRLAIIGEAMWQINKIDPGDCIYRQSQNHWVEAYSYP